MAQISDRAILPEETFNMLRERAAKEGSDCSFTVKVLRRAYPGGVPDLVATLSGATLEHLSSPELWVPPLCGGGNFSMQAYHPTDLSKAVGGFIQFKVGSQDAKEVDGSVIKKSDWRGPPTLDFPQREPAREQQVSMYDIRPPPAPDSSGSATGSSSAWTRSAGGGSVQRQEYGGETAWQVSARALEGERRKLEEERLVNEREKHRNELVAVAKAHDADMRALKAEILAAMQQQKPDNTSSMLAEFMKMQAEERRITEERAAVDRRERERIAAEDRRAAELRQEKNDERLARVLEKMTERPKEDPLAMIEKVAGLIGKNNNNEAQMKMMNSMAEMHSVQMGSAMDFIEHAANMQLGGPQEKESPVVKAVEAGLKGFGAIMRGAQKRPAPQQFAQAPALPPTYEQQARAQPAPAQQPMPTALEQIEAAIRQKIPVANVAAAFITHFQDPSIQAAILEAGGDTEALIQKRLGNWPLENPENKIYLDALLAEVEKRLQAAGLFGEDDAANQADGDDGEDE